MVAYLPQASPAWYFCNPVGYIFILGDPWRDTMMTDRVWLAVLIFISISVFSVISPNVSIVHGQTLRFNPDPFISEDYDFTVPLVIEAGGLEVKGVECQVSFDSALVSLTSITPGPWYTNSNQEFFFWDYTYPGTNIVSFASAMLDGSNSSDDVIALCHFSFVDFGTSPLDFDLVDVRGITNQPLPFESDNGIIYLGDLVEAETLSFDTLKAIYQ